MTAKASAKNNNGKASIRQKNEATILNAAEAVFAEHGFSGATTKMISERAGIPKANLHYYFATKAILYGKVVDNIFSIWLEAANSFDDCDEPADALKRYIAKKMDISRDNPMGSKVWANEIIHNAPSIQIYLETELKVWTASRAKIIQRWIDDGKLRPIDPHHLLYMIWATTQHYADFDHQIKTLNGGKKLSDEQFEAAKADIIEMILAGVLLKSDKTP